MAGERRIAVIGGGISGLAAALRLRERAPAGTRITLYEQSQAPGGKLRTGSLAGSVVEFGAEAFLTRDPAGGESAALRLARRLGLGADLVHPTVGRAALSIGGTLRPVPGGTLVGVPGDLARLDGVARALAERDRDEGRPLLAAEEDVAVGELVRARLGDEVVDRLVDPMLGGVYAGRADMLSLSATMPRLAEAARTEPTLVRAVRAAQSATSGVSGAPVFTTVAGGVGRLVDAAVRTFAAADAPAIAPAAGDGSGPPVTEVRCGTVVRELTRTPTGWRLVLGSTRDPELSEVDGVVLAVPARPAGRLLAGVHPGVAERIGRLDYASVALVTLALPPVRLPELSGFLVPATEHRLVKAATFFTTKWAHLRRPDGTVLVRASVGRYGEEEQLQRSDEELIAEVHRELTLITGTALPAPLATHVQRWGGALPQYPPGHPARVAAARAMLRAEHPTVTLAGAAYDGVGIPVCVRSGETAADEIIRTLEGTTR